MEFSALSIALVAGVLATFNPCGFALLPAYLSALVLGNATEVAAQTPRQTKWAPYVRAVRFSAGMAIGVVAIFAIFALVIYPFAISIEAYLPVVTALIGIALIIFGVQLLRGKSLTIRRFLNPNIAPRQQFLTQIGYGVTFALGSLSCTVGPFLAIASTSIASGNLLTLIFSFLLYGAGMALMILILAIATAAANRALISRLRQAQGVIEKITAILVILVGIYISFYAWFEIQSYAGNIAPNPVIDFALTIQSWIVQTVLAALNAIGLA